MRAYNRKLKNSITNVERLRARKGAKRISLSIKSRLFDGYVLLVSTKVKDGTIHEKIRYVGEDI